MSDRGARGVQLDVIELGARRLVHHDARGLLELLEGGGRPPLVDHVGLPSEEERPHGRLLLDGPVDHAGDLVGLPAPPVTRKGLHDQRGGAVPRFLRVGSRAGDVVPEIRLAVVAGVAVGARLLVGEDLVAVDDEELGQGREKGAYGWLRVNTTVCGPTARTCSAVRTPFQSHEKPFFSATIR